MGIPGILKEIGKGERVALSKLAVEHLERTQRPLRIAIDAAIWNFQSQAGQGGKNPALRTLFYRLLKLLALPIQPLFVYDGKNKPLIKRGRTVSRWGTCIANETSKKLIQHFRFSYHVAPGEAEAECALLQRRGIVDMVMSQDGDAIMFGSQLTLRDWSKEGTRGNKSPTHVNLLELSRMKERCGLDPEGMILVALLSGGDYDQNGVAGFGPGLACEIARAGFATDFLDLVRKDDEAGLKEWRQRLQYELESNESGYFKRRHKTLKVPDTFPDRTLVSYYINPAVSKDEDLAKLEKDMSKTWKQDIDIPELRNYVGDTFDWLYKPGAWKFVRSMAPPLLAHRLLRGLADQYITSADQIQGRRKHFTSDGIPELRVVAVPAQIVDLDLEAEEDSPEYLARLSEEQGQDEDANDAEVAREDDEVDEDVLLSQDPRKQRKRPPWNPSDPEKMWIPETMLQLGIPALVEEWQQNERDKLADPKKFATRKCKKTTLKILTTSRAGRIEQHFATSKVRTDLQTVENGVGNPLQPLSKNESTQQMRTPTKKLPEVTVQPSSPSIKQFFKATKTNAAPPQDASKILAGQKHPRPTTSNSSTKEDPVMGGPNQPDGTGSLMEPVAVLSSPVMPDKRNDLLCSAPSTPRKGASNTAEDDPVELPDSVTQRKKGRAEVRLKEVRESVRASPRPKTLESFFRPETVKSNSSHAQEVETGQSVRLKMPCEPGTGLQVDFVPNKLCAMPRESLPGTWRKVDLDEEVMSMKAKRTARISYVDLADD